MPDAGANYLQNKNTVSKNFIVAYRSMALAATVTEVAFNGIDDSIFHSFDDSGMIRKPVLRSGFSVRTIPIIEDYYTRRGRRESMRPLKSTVAVGAFSYLSPPAFLIRLIRRLQAQSSFYVPLRPNRRMRQIVLSLPCNRTFLRFIRRKLFCLDVCNQFITG